MNRPIVLSPEARRAASQRLQQWLKGELNQDVGGLQAEALIEVVLTDIGPMFYNRGVADARTVVAARAEDLDDALHGLERQSPLR